MTDTNAKIESKMARATKIVATALENKDRAKIAITDLMDQLQMSQPAASTYYYTIKGRLTGKTAPKVSKKEAKAAEAAKREAKNAKRRESRKAKKGAELSTRGQPALDQTPDAVEQTEIAA